MQPGAREVSEVGCGVLPGVEDDRHVRVTGRDASRCGDRLVLAAQLAGHGGELGDVGPVAGVGVPGQRDPAVPGDHQAQAHQPQVGALLLGLAALRHRRLAVAGIDEGREVGHVQRHRRAVHAGGLHDPHGELAGDLCQLPEGDGVHRIPEPAVIQRRGGDLGEPAGGGGLPPVREGQLRARRDQPVQRSQHQVGTRGQRQPGRARAGHFIDNGGHAEILQHAPRRGDRAELLVTGPVRQAQPAAAHRGRQLPGGPQVLLRDDPGLAVHAGGLHQVVVRGIAAFLPHNGCHIWVIHPQAGQDKHRHGMSPGEMSQTRLRPGVTRP